VDVQRGGPSTGLPTKTEQSDLLQAVVGRNGDAPVPVLACSTPSDAFECAVEACRIAVQYMTPVILLTDGYIANGSEPWRLPDASKLQGFKRPFAKPTEESFLPYDRDARGARPWAVPGTPGLEHRVGGLEKWDKTGHISYDPQNHERMTILREQKVLGVRESIPTPSVTGPGTGDLLVLGWGSTRGAITSAVDAQRKAGRSVARIHLRHVWPFPKGLGEILTSYKAVLVPEMNRGQMARLLRSEYPQANIVSFPKVQGLPFFTREIEAKIESLLES